jgi:hypothetical protein
MVDLSEQPLRTGSKFQARLLNNVTNSGTGHGDGAEVRLCSALSKTPLLHLIQLQL